MTTNKLRIASIDTGVVTNVYWDAEDLEEWTSDFIDRIEVTLGDLIGEDLNLPACVMDAMVDTGRWKGNVWGLDTRQWYNLEIDLINGFCDVELIGWTLD